MNQNDMYRVMMLSALVLACIAGLGCVGLLIACAITFHWAMFWASLVLGVCTVLFAIGAVQCSQELNDTKKVFTNEAEKEVLTRKQRAHLRTERGQVVMQRAMVEIEKERENITHRAIETANDPMVPPHKTRWTTEDDGGRQLR